MSETLRRSAEAHACSPMHEHGADMCGAVCTLLRTQHRPMLIHRTTGMRGV